MKTRRNSIKVWVSDEERTLLEAKVNYYGYKRLATYIRDAVIYEKITHIDLDGKEQIYNAYSENTKELKKIAKEIRHISRYATQINKDEIKNLTSQMYEILNMQRNILNIIENKLDLNVWQEIKHSNEDLEKMQNASN